MPEKLKMHTPDHTAQNIQKLAELFPDCVTEIRDEAGKVTQGIDFDQLRQELSGVLVEGPRERYHLDWPGKREAILAANAPIAKTLRPSRNESVNFDTTKNLFIEGDNLDALKLLQETYLGKVKLIYIDPPYNTGNDFIYEDDFSEDSDAYLLRSNQEDEVGNRLIANTEANGRFHSDWLTMLYARLKLARNLLRDDGFIAVSIDDVEMPRLRDVLDEVYGSANFLAVLVFDRNRKNDARFFSVGHEYMVIYARSKAFLMDSNIKLRAPKQGVDEVRALFEQLRLEHDDDWDLVRSGLKDFYKTFGEDDPRLPLARFTKVDEKGPYRDDADISWPGGSGPRYGILHPTTNRPCKLPSRGWIYPNAQRFWEEYRNGRIVFGASEDTIPSLRTNLFLNNTQVLSSVRYSYAQTSANQFDELFGGLRVFDNPKPVDDLVELVQYLCGPDDLIMDFFAGSGTLGHAVEAQNANDAGHRRYILVQIPQALDPEDSDQKVAAEFLASIGRPLNIAEITKERLRRAANKLTADRPLFKGDKGFRVLKIDSSNMRDVYYSPDAVEQVDLMGQIENIRADRAPEDLLFQVLADWGLDLALPIAEETIEGKQVFFVDQNALSACFDTGVTDEMVKAIAQRKPLRAVFRDSSYGTDSVKINVEQIFKLLSPETEVRSI
jgi:adenine-specific DNA-methyltransferase